MDNKDNKIIMAGGIKTFTAIGTGVLGLTAVLINSVECLTVSPNHFSEVICVHCGMNFILKLFEGMMVFTVLFIVSSICCLIVLVYNLCTSIGCRAKCSCCKSGSGKFGIDYLI